jgi:hypothetical protein
MCLIAILLAAPVFAQGNIPAGATIYIEKMENDLDGFMKAEFIKQNVPLKVVLTPEEAELVVTGAGSKDEKKSWSEGWLTTGKDHNVGNIMVVRKENKEMLWAGEAGDRSLWWGSLARGGQRKVASRLVKNLKKAIGPAVARASPSK